MPNEAVALRQFGKISASENKFLHGLLAEKRSYPARLELITPDAPMNSAFFLLEGWACLAASLPNGSRQILDFYLPGDLVAYCSRPGAVATASYVTLTEVKVASADDLSGCARRPDEFRKILPALWAIEGRFEKRLTNHIIRHGKHSAKGRVMSLLTEFHDRFESNGQLDGDQFQFPLTQAMLADALGLSEIHVNRSLQELRQSGLIAYGGAAMEVCEQEPTSL